MAFNRQRIDPLDLQPRKAIGVSFPFSGTAVFNSTYSSKEAIKSNLINFFLTGRGERYLNPLFGSGLRNLLFENLTERKIKQLDREIRDAMTAYFPRVIVKELKLEGIPDTNVVEFSLQYSISQSNIEDEIVINIEQ